MNDKNLYTIRFVNGSQITPIYSIESVRSSRANNIIWLHEDYFIPNINYPKTCRSRKRFIKLMMSLGYSKQFATLIAKNFLSIYGSYNKIWQEIFLKENRNEKL